TSTRRCSSPSRRTSASASKTSSTGRGAGRATSLILVTGSCLRHPSSTSGRSWTSSTSCRTVGSGESAGRHRRGPPDRVRRPHGARRDPALPRDRHARPACAARAPRGGGAPPRAHAGRAAAARPRPALTEISPPERAWSPLVFTAHSVPVVMADGSPYVADLTGAARAVAERLGHARWSLAYQSRSGSPREPWLEPDIADVLTRLAADGERHAVVVPIGFVSDHVELLYDLDVEARAIASAHGITLHRAAALNDHPAFIAMLADLVREHGGAAGVPSSATLADTEGDPSSHAGPSQS